MNYFAHGRHFLDDPYFLAGTAVPDWLNVVDRKVRARSKGAQRCVDDTDPRVASLARGIMQHHHDDEWFHQTRVFAELSWQFTVMVRDAIAADENSPDDGMRPSFLGHILVELLLDSALIEEHSQRLDQYYATIEKVDAILVQATVNRIASQSTDRLHEFIDMFCAHRFLFDYLDDEKLFYRLNQVMRRVRLSPLPNSILNLLPQARCIVTERKSDLLAPHHP